MREEDIYFGTMVAAPVISLLAPAAVYLTVGFEASVVTGITILILLRLSDMGSIK